MPEEIKQSEQERGLAALESLRTQIVDSVKAKFDPIERQITELKTALAERGGHDPEIVRQIELLGKRTDQLQAQLSRPETDQPLGMKSIAEIVYEHEECKKFRERAGIRGGFTVKMPSLFREQKTVISSSAVGSSTPGILVPQRVPGIVPAAERLLRVRDLMPSAPTSNNAIEFVKENVFTNAASPQGADGTSKAESALTFTIDHANVTTIAHWIPASRQVLDDFQGLQAYVDRKLLYGLKLKEDAELLTGDGLGTHISGLITEATAYAGTYAVAADTRIDTIRRAILETEVADEVVSGVVLNPIDYARIETTKEDTSAANTGRYILGDPSTGAVIPTIWGKLVVVSNTMPSGRFLVGAFALQAQIYDRQQAAIDVSTEHDDYFIRNLVAIRAEERLALAVFRGGAFRYGSF